MEIRWYGHACFRIATEASSIITDPYDPSIGIAPREPLESDIVTVSHGHYDHNNVGLVRGAPLVISTPGEHLPQSCSGCRIFGMSTYHDEDAGAKRGQNTVFLIEIDSARVCHLGDLGHVLNSAQIERLKPIDILLVPVGGTYTLDAHAAASLVRALSPRIAVPMHYAIPGLKISIDPVDRFLEEMNASDAERVEALSFVRDEKTRESKPLTQIVVMNPIIK